MIIEKRRGVMSEEDILAEMSKGKTLHVLDFSGKHHLWLSSTIPQYRRKIKYSTVKMFIEKGYVLISENGGSGNDSQFKRLDYIITEEGKEYLKALPELIKAKEARRRRRKKKEKEKKEESKK